MKYAVPDKAGAFAIRSHFCALVERRGGTRYQHALKSDRYLPEFLTAWKHAKEAGVSPKLWVDSLDETMPPHFCNKAWGRDFPPPNVIATRKHAARVREALEKATRRQVEDGFDWKELHMDRIRSGLKASAPLVKVHGSDPDFFYGVLVEGGQISPWWLILPPEPAGLRDFWKRCDPEFKNKLGKAEDNYHKLDASERASLEKLKRDLMRGIIT